VRILILNADYPGFLTWLYRQRPWLAGTSYATQMGARDASFFGVANFYSKNFSALGHTSAELHVNNRWMQAAWAREHGIRFEPPPVPIQAIEPSVSSWLRRATAPIKPWLRPLARKMGLVPHLDAQSENILLAQIEEFKPDLVLNQDLFYVNTRLAHRIAQIGRPVLIGQIGVAPPLAEDWSAYDLIVSQLSSVVKFFRDRHVRSELVHLAFEASILEALPAPTPLRLDVSFVGSVSSDHQRRVALLEAVARNCDLKFYGPGIQSLPRSSPLHKCYQGEVWGVDMYRVLRASRVTLNAHLDAAPDDAGNMRLFEATGVGTFLLTDAKRNLADLFEPGCEVATWSSVEDCLNKIKTALDNDDRRQAVARAGQARTLSQHTYRRRTQTLLELAARLQ
jgi:hypothetical protein